MPSRNTIRQDVDNHYYHVYSRGISKKDIFRDESDKDYFLYLIARHLSAKPRVTKEGYQYPHYTDAIELLSFCLMDNHFHLLFYQLQQGSLSSLMKSILVAYTAYFNRKYEQSGPIFDSRYKASLISDETYLMHISRYIHLNPRSWKYFTYSSLPYIRESSEPEWLQTERILSQHANRAAYLKFVADYEDHKRLLDETKSQLADL